MAVGMAGAGTAPIRSEEAAADLFRHELAALAHEELRVAHFDAALRLIGMTAARGSRDHIVELPLRAIVTDALRLESHALIVAHNHPGGDPTPSQADKAATRRLADVTRPLGIRLLDHLVFGGDRFVSFRALGLL